MAFIFGGSTNLLSSGRTSRFLVPFLKWLNPSFTIEQLKEAQYFIRKCGHVSEYAVLSVLLWNAKRGTDVLDKKRFWECARFAVLIAAFYAGTDELHQAFEPSRESAVLDVFIDTCGAMVGLFFIWLFGRWRKFW